MIYDTSSSLFMCGSTTLVYSIRNNFERYGIHGIHGTVWYIWKYENTVALR